MIHRRIGPATVCISMHHSWIGIDAFCVGARNHKHQRPLFSERYRANPHRRYLHVGRWCFSTDTNWMGGRT